MDFRNSTASYTRFGGIFIQVDVAHSAVCGGAQAFGVLGEVVKLHDFLIWWTLFLRNSSGFDLVCQETCSPTLYHLALRKFRIAHSKFNLGTLQKQLRDCPIMFFHEIRMLRMENLAT